MHGDQVMGGDPRRAAVMALLAAHRPVDRAEADHLSATRDLVAGRAHPFDRTVFAPGHLTASGFVVGPGGAVLLVHHRAIGAWLQPGGHVDPTDPAAAAAAEREIVEETGATGLVLERPGLLDVDVHRHPGKPGREPPHLHFDLRFGFTTPHRALAPSPEVRGARWFDATELAALGVDESVARPVRTMLGRLAGGEP